MICVRNFFPQIKGRAKVEGVRERVSEKERVDLIGSWRRTHNHEVKFVILIKYYFGNGIKENEMGWTCGTRSIYRALVGNHEGGSPFG